MQSTFSNCENLKTLNLNCITSNKIRNMAATFQNCKNLKTIRLENIEELDENFVLHLNLDPLSTTFVDTPVDLKIYYKRQIVEQLSK